MRAPTGQTDPKAIFRSVKASNKDLPTDNWRVAKVADQWSDYREAVIILNEKLLPLINAHKDVLNYGFGSIEFTVCKSNFRVFLRPSSDPIPLGPVQMNLL